MGVADVMEWACWAARLEAAGAAWAWAWACAVTADAAAGAALEWGRRRGAREPKARMAVEGSIPIVFVLRERV